MAEANLALEGEAKRIIVLLRKEDMPKSKFRRHFTWIAALVVLVLGLSLGYRMAALFSPEPPPPSQSTALTERVRGGLYALELASPSGKSRWMLEFDAEIVTKDGPSNPLELRNALEDLVIAATSLPLVQASENPDRAMRRAMLAIAAQNYPWLVDVHMTRSDIRTESDRLGGIGRAMRNLYSK